MNFQMLVYEDNVIAVSLMAEDLSLAQKNLLNLAIRYLLPESHIDKNGEIVHTTNKMNGETDWFILPHSFGAVVGKRLIEQKVSGLPGFTEDGFARMVKWLIEMEQLHDCMVY